MDRETKTSNLATVSKKLNDLSDFCATEGHSKGAPIQWESIETQYDSGPKMGID